MIFPQIAIAIGVLTSNRGGGRRTTLADWTWWCHCWVPLHIAIVVWVEGGLTTNFGGVDVVPLLGAIVGCHCSVVWLGGR